MNEEKRKIYELLSSQKITADEADEMLQALNQEEQQKTGIPPALETQVRQSKPKAKYLRILVDARENGEKKNVNIKIPLGLIRSGAKLSNLIPDHAKDKINDTLKSKGLNLNISNPAEIEAFIEELQEASIDINASEKGEEAIVQIFCE